MLVAFYIDFLNWAKTYVYVARELHDSIVLGFILCFEGLLLGIELGELASEEVILFNDLSESFLERLNLIVLLGLFRNLGYHLISFFCRLLFLGGGLSFLAHLGRRSEIFEFCVSRLFVVFSNSTCLSKR